MPLRGKITDEVIFSNNVMRLGSSLRISPKVAGWITLGSAFAEDRKYDTPERKYSPSRIESSQKNWITGSPDPELISTSYVERLNASTRCHVKRLGHLTLAFSKRRVNFEAAVALHFAAYNFVRPHRTLKMTPAIMAGVEKNFWSYGDLVEAVS